MTEEEKKKLYKNLSKSPFPEEDVGKLVKLKFPRRNNPYGSKYRPVGIIIGSENKRGHIVPHNVSNIKAVIFFDRPNVIERLHVIAFEILTE